MALLFESQESAVLVGISDISHRRRQNRRNGMSFLVASWSDPLEEHQKACSLSLFSCCWRVLNQAKYENKNVFLKTFRLNETILYVQAT